MEYSFETPLINRLRRAFSSPLVLISSLFFLVSAAAYGIYAFVSVSAIMILLSAAALCAFLTGLTAFVSAKRKDRKLPSAPLTFGAAASVVAAAGVIVAFNVFGRSCVRPTLLFLSSFGLLQTPVGEYSGYIATAAGVVYSIFSFLFLLTAACSVRNNKPHTFFAGAYTAVSLVCACGLLFAAIYGTVMATADGITLTKEFIYTSLTSLFSFASLFTSGLCGVKYIQMSGGGKNETV